MRVFASDTPNQSVSETTFEAKLATYNKEMCHTLCVSITLSRDRRPNCCSQRRLAIQTSPTAPRNSHQGPIGSYTVPTIPSANSQLSPVFLKAPSHHPQRTCIHGQPASSCLEARFSVAPAISALGPARHPDRYLSDSSLWALWGRFAGQK